MFFCLMTPHIIYTYTVSLQPKTYRGAVFCLETYADYFSAPRSHHRNSILPWKNSKRCNDFECDVHLLSCCQLLLCCESEISAKMVILGILAKLHRNVRSVPAGFSGARLQKWRRKRSSTQRFPPDRWAAVLKIVLSNFLRFHPIRARNGRLVQKTFFELCSWLCFRGLSQQFELSPSFSVFVAHGDREEPREGRHSRLARGARARVWLNVGLWAHMHRNSVSRHW